MTEITARAALASLLGQYATRDTAERVLALADDSGDHESILQAVINGQVVIERMVLIRREQWLAAQPRLSREAREAVTEVSYATVAAGMRTRRAFARQDGGRP